MSSLQQKQTLAKYNFPFENMTLSSCKNIITLKCTYIYIYTIKCHIYVKEKKKRRKNYLNLILSSQKHISKAEYLYSSENDTAHTG